MDFDLLPGTGTFFNCHVHIFNFYHVPDRYLPLSLVRILARIKNLRPLASFLNKLNPFSDNDIFNRYLNFLNNGLHKSQAEILDNLLGYYPSSANFVVLSVDMTYMGAGIPYVSYENQLEELAAIWINPVYSKRIYPFIFADPRRPNIMEMLKKYIDLGFKGIKIYPAMGCFPFDDKYDPIFRLAVERNIPVLTHCSPYGANTRIRIEDLPEINPVTKEHLTWKKNFKRYDQFGDPDNYRKVLEKYPNLKICFGHFGGFEEMNRYLDAPTKADKKKSWFHKIKELMAEYQNVYADISFLDVKMKVVPLINIAMTSEVHKSRILFGTDFYMDKIAGSERRYSIYLRESLGEENFKRIAGINPRKFLGLD
jgi:predicted TIM-barrel fold metal-dependent hydrolase